MSQQLAELPKSTLLQKLHGQLAANKRARSHAEALGEKVLDVVGGATAMATGAAIGYAEIAWADKDTGKPMSIGPLDLSLAVGGVATALAFFGINPARQMTAVAHAGSAVYGASRGRAAAIERKKKEADKTGTKTGYAIGSDDDLTDEERAFIDS